MGSYKIIKSGHIVEIYEYEKPLIRNADIDADKPERVGRAGEGKEERKEEYKMTVNIRARNNLRRLISANFTNGDLFITLTFADNITDIDKANYELKKFVQKMQRRSVKFDKEFKYVAVIEFQNRGAIHYHMICNYPLTWKDEKMLKLYERQLGKIWGNGFVDIKDISNVDNTGAYLIKYMSKDYIDERLEGKKRYFHTRKMIQPQTIEGEELLTWLNTLEGQKPVFTNEYNSEFNGKVKYKEFNPRRWL